MNVVLIPCFNRPEFLFYVIEQIKKADNANKYHYIFRPDFGWDKTGIETVIGGFPYSYQIVPTPSNQYNRTFRKRSASKQSYNVLSGYILAAGITDHLVFMIEEDIMISKDFFTFHETVHRQHPEIFCSLSVRNINRQVLITGNHDEYYLSHGDYCSLGVCLTRKVICDLIMPHVNHQYFTDPTSYVASRFPNSSIGKHFSEQDGLIRRIQEVNPDKPTVYPFIPRAYHAGYYGYNRKRGMYGTLEMKKAAVGKVIFSREAMQKEAIAPEYYNDSIPQDLILPPWEKLTPKEISQQI